MITELSWSISSTARRLVWLVGIVVAAAFAADRPGLLAFAAFPLIQLLFLRRGKPPERVTVDFTQPDRCFEGEEITVTVAASCDRPVELIRIALQPVREFKPARGIKGERSSPSSAVRHTSSASLQTTVTPDRWGKRPVGYAHIQLWADGGFQHSQVAVWPTTEVSIYPRPAPMARFDVSSTRYDRAGEHPASVAGPGVEFHSVRPFAPGDRPRRVNWPVSTRRGQLYVTSFAAERAVDVVLAVDVLTDAGPPGRSSRDLALRGATGVAQTVLRAHDRVGLVAVGGYLTWLKPDLSERQFYRIADAVLAVLDWFSYLDPNVDSIPYAALPAGSLVIFFSPLVDSRAVSSAQKLRTRGHPVVVVDVCTSEPRAHTEAEQDARRFWRLNRIATRNRLVGEGITVCRWNGVDPLDTLLRPFLRARALR